MKNKGLIALWIGYITWIVIASKFIKKDKKKKFENKIDELKADFVQVHKDFFEYLEKKLLSEENKKTVEEYQKKIEKEVEDFKKEASGYLESIKEKWISKKDEIEKDIHLIYEKRMEYIEKLKNQASILYEDIKDAILETIEESKEKIENTYKETKKKIKN